MDWFIFRPVSIGDLVRTCPVARVSCDWDVFASPSWKPSNHSVLEMSYTPREPLSPIWGCFKMTTTWYCSQNKPTNANPNPNPNTLTQGTLHPKQLKEESRWGAPLTSVWGRSPTYTSQGRETDIHPGDKLSCTYAYEVRWKVHLTQPPASENEQCHVLQPKLAD